MIHIRRSFLENLRNQLKTLSGFGGVWIHRIGPSRNAYPCITVFSDSETIETEGLGAFAREQERLLTVSVSVWIRGTPDDEKAESDMDDAALAIENLLDAPPGVSEMKLVSTEFQVSEDEPEIHVVTLQYQISYCTHEADAGV